MRFKNKVSREQKIALSFICLHLAMASAFWILLVHPNVWAYITMLWGFAMLFVVDYTVGVDEDE